MGAVTSGDGGDVEFGIACIGAVMYCCGCDWNCVLGGDDHAELSNGACSYEYHCGQLRGVGDSTVFVCAGAPPVGIYSLGLRRYVPARGWCVLICESICVLLAMHATDTRLAC